MALVFYLVQLFGLSAGGGICPVDRWTAGPEVLIAVASVSGIRPGGLRGASAAPVVLERPLLLAAAGGAVATGVEYGMALFYERVLRVSFWNYEGLPGSIQGRVCIPFALAWSLLMLPLVYLLHPAAARLAAAIPDPVSWAVLAALLGDLAISGGILRRTGERACLQWYRRR